jgi:putative membrane protein
MSATWALAFSFAVIGFVSAIYEMFEWLLTIVAAGATADWYNGQQGDVWDPQKDMAAAQTGALIAVTFLGLRHSRQGVGETISGDPDDSKE